MSMTLARSDLYAILSDTHFGDGGPADDFGPTDGPQDFALAKVIDRCWQENRTLVLAGDIFELSQFNIFEIVRAHRMVISEIFKRAKRYAVGNHDIDLLRETLFDLKGEPYVIEGNLWIEHGHAHDELVRHHPRLCRAVTWLGGVAERVIDRDVDLWAEKVAGWFGHTGHWGANEGYLLPVIRCAAEHGCDTAVFGHTHQALTVPTESDQYPGVKVYNAGTWTNGKQDVVLL